ncbi:TPR domain protein [Labilithrix luteola]|uniref:TPR domain protein n=1 Tax=Labilithrix luteola TaxID=1391654 RepID=A0A0K1Q0I7_9BACT|nr:multiheme c-type cytochrome [Labilithrix luteola]AKU98929.1 TPR domain protein [Labilithrix luteola]
MTSPVEIALVLGALAAASALVWQATRQAPRARALLIMGLGLSTSAALLPVRRAPAAAPPEGTPRASSAVGYVSSAACRSCHPSEHASFSRTFHRTMTQRAEAKTVLASETTYPLDGRAVRLARRGDEVWATLPDPDAPPPAPDVTRRVVLTTGSHREQAYWVAGKREGELRLFPLVWLVADQRFVPRRDAFLTPPDADLPNVRWNSNCIACHAVAGEPKHDLATDAFGTRVGELGIACEACHGPGAVHVEKHRDPVARYVQHASEKADLTIVQPARLPPERSAAVCGQCHAYSFPRDEDAFWTSGYVGAFRPGELLEPSRFLLSPATLRETPGLPRIEADLDSLFWPDGSIRVGGREYNGLVESPCFQKGQGERKLTCLSCHSMHLGDPSKQIAPEHAGDGGCTTCHADARSRSHGHHAEGSAGSACVACHMPRTSYALFSAIRSHRIDSPSASASIETGKPNACNLCHLDRSLAWTATWLSTWYGQAMPSIPPARTTTAEGAVLALSGDAAMRVLVADALGSPEARAAVGAKGEPLRAALLAELLIDPYAAVRFVAGKSLAKVDGFADVPYDFLDAFALRMRAHDEVRRRVNEADTGLGHERIRQLLDARDSRPLTIAE